MIVLFNFNSYLGGGETLFVRFANYLYINKYSFKLFYLKDSYIANDLYRIGIPQKTLFPIDLNTDYYYLKTNQRQALLREIVSHLNIYDEEHLISFCARDLYILIDVLKISKLWRITHLILHDQDNLYVCQTLFDKLIYKLFNKRQFSSLSTIEFNRIIFNKLNESHCLIPMSDLMVNLWNEKYKININSNSVVPLPVFDFPKNQQLIVKENNKAIIWVGRIVDFKIPALCSMINFIAKNEDYKLTIVGDGNMNKIFDYIRKNNISHDRISFKGKIPYDKLGEIINNHAIGYAMGTSIIEIARYGLPVIMALGSPSHKLFKEDICGGLYANVSIGNVGDNLFAGQDESTQHLITDTIKEINDNYNNACKICYKYVSKEYDININIQKYLSLIDSSRYIDTQDINIPNSSWLRRQLFHIFNS